MQTIKTKDNKEIDIKNVRWFGNEVKKNYRKDGGFKSFDLNCWIKTHKGELHYINTTIGKLKKLFPNYESQKKEIKEYKESNGKTKRAFEWVCKIISEEGGEKIRSDQIETIENAIKNHKGFSLDGKFLYFYIEDHLFKDSKNDKLVYIDIDKHLIIPLNLELPYSRVDVDEWLANYRRNN